MRLTVSSLLIVMIVFTGCRSTGEPSPEIQARTCPGFDAPGAGEVKVRFVDRPEVTVVATRCVMRNGLMRVDVDVRNDRRTEQRLAYRFEWYEAYGMSADTEEAWKPILLYPEDIKTLRSVAPSEAVEDFVVVIKS
jgi:hypothetical protein